MNRFKRLMLVMAIAITSVAAGITASANYSKASTDFTYKGVSVKVVDRSSQIGRSHTNTYGYTVFENRNDYTVNLNWRAYGLSKRARKLVMVDSGSITIGPNKTHKEVYSYTTGKGELHTEYEKYVVAIELEELEEAPLKDQVDKFTKDGVEVEIADRRSQIGRSHTNTNGYLTFNNHNNYSVKVEWEVYGVTRQNKRTKVDSGTIGINPKSVYKEVYSYTSSKYPDYKEFKSYSCQIKVTNVDQTAPTNVTEANAASIYSRIRSHSSSGKLDQQDYADAMAIMSLDVKKLYKIYSQAERAEKNGDDGALDRAYRQNKTLIDRTEYLGDLLEAADKKGKLNSANKAALERLKKEFDAIDY